MKKTLVLKKYANRRLYDTERSLEEIWGTLDYYQRKERCIFCDIIKEEILMKNEG